MVSGTIHSNVPCYVAVIPLGGAPQVMMLAESDEDELALCADVETRRVVFPLLELIDLQPEHASA